MVTLNFAKAKKNAKLVKLGEKLGISQFYTFSLLSGHSCPFAHICKTKAIRENGKTHIERGQHAILSCFSANAEALFPSVYDSRKHNFDALREAKTTKNMVKLIDNSLPKPLKTKGGLLRIHVGGDFFSQSYFDAWLAVAKLYPQSVFYAYTKSIPYVVNRLPLPANFRITASRGGKADELIDKYNLVNASIVFSLAEANQKGLELDHDDSHAVSNTVSFGLMIHGVQPAGSTASKAKHAYYGKGGYTR